MSHIESPFFLNRVFLVLHYFNMPPSYFRICYSWQIPHCAPVPNLAALGELSLACPWPFLYHMPDWTSLILLSASRPPRLSQLIPLFPLCLPRFGMCHLYSSGNSSHLVAIFLPHHWHSLCHEILFILLPQNAPHHSLSSTPIWALLVCQLTCHSSALKGLPSFVHAPPEISHIPRAILLKQDHFCSTCR